MLFLLMINARAWLVPFLVIATIAAPSRNSYFLIIMALVLAFIETFDANDRVILELAIVAFECEGIV